MAWSFARTTFNIGHLPAYVDGVLAPVTGRGSCGCPMIPVKAHGPPSYRCRPARPPWVGHAGGGSFRAFRFAAGAPAVTGTATLSSLPKIVLYDGCPK